MTVHINEGYPSGVNSITPQGTNSTMFTECCDVALCSSEICCPKCHRTVIGYGANSDHERGLIRWAAATRHWKR